MESHRVMILHSFIIGLFLYFIMLFIFKNNQVKATTRSILIGTIVLIYMILFGYNLPIVESDIMYKDYLVCILKPDVKKGIIIKHRYIQQPKMDSICKTGLKTGTQMYKEGIYFGRTEIHPYIFFRAPFHSKVIDYTTTETEIISSYGKIENNSVYIRVDPDNTYVFSSELRVKKPEDLDRSKKLLSDYLVIIAENAEIYKTMFPLDITQEAKLAYNLFSSKLIPISNTKLDYPLNNAPIERNSEILVSIPHLTSNYFVLCT